MASYRAVSGESLGPPDGYALVERDPAPLAAGEVRIRVAAAGVGFVDVLIAGGGYQVKPPTPYVPGLELSGTIVETGPGIDPTWIGQRVAAAAGMGGAFAEEAVVPADSAIPLSDTLDFPAAATAFVNYQTAWHALTQRAALRTGETLLVLGGAGGVGAACIEVAKLLGARVVATGSSAAKRDHAVSLGADAAIAAPGAEGWREAVRAATGGVAPT